MRPGLPDAPLWVTYYGTITQQKIWAKSYDLGYSFGGAYAINDIFSISAAIRYVDGTIEAKRKGYHKLRLRPALGLGCPSLQTSETLTLSKTLTAGGQFLVLTSLPNDRLNIGARFETKTDLEFDTDV